MKKKKLKDYTQEELNNLSYSEKEALLMQYNVSRTIKWVVGVVIALFLIIALFNSFKSIPTGYVGVKTRFGEVQNTVMNEGINFKVPFIEKIVLIDCRTQKLDYTMEASSKDLQKITNLKVSVNYNVVKDSANKLYREIGTSYQSVVLEPALYEAIKSTIANYTAEELITKRSEVSALATEAFFNRVHDYGIIVTALNITDLSFSPEFDAVIEQKQIVEQQTKQAQLELEKAKIENETKIENAKAEAEVMKQQNAQITNQTLRLKELEIMEEYVEKWNGQLPSTMLNDNLTGLFNLNK